MGLREVWDRLWEKAAEELEKKPKRPIQVPQIAFPLFFWEIFWSSRDAMACEFLAHVNLNLPYFWNAANAGTCPVLELLKAQKFEELLELVKEGKVSCGEPLHASGSLLELAMPIFWHNAKGDPVADVEIMLKAMKQRKEALTESHLYTACQAGPAPTSQRFRSSSLAF